jgi:hypothetical protein
MQRRISVNQQQAIAVLSNNRKRLGEALPCNSFVVSSQVQKAPYSNSNKQVHLNVVHVGARHH